jgi:hypothetical protein
MGWQTTDFWTEADTTQLRELIMKGLSVGEIARKLRRTERAVRTKAERLKISLRSASRGW